MRLLIVATLALAIGGQIALAQRQAPGILIAPRRQPPAPQHFHALSLFGGLWYPAYVNQPVRPAPEIIVIQQPAAPVPAVKEEPKPITPLMIEWQDGRYVRSDSRNNSSAQFAAKTTASMHAREKMARTASATIVPALLIFRDGHSERVREYTITDGAIYARGDYWADGFWNKKILLLALDISATLSANRGTGAKFELPSAPNVVIVRP